MISLYLHTRIERKQQTCETIIPSQLIRPWGRLLWRKLLCRVAGRDTRKVARLVGVKGGKMHLFPNILGFFFGAVAVSVAIKFLQMHYNKSCLRYPSDCFHAMRVVVSYRSLEFVFISRFLMWLWAPNYKCTEKKEN